MTDVNTKLSGNKINRSINSTLLFYLLFCCWLLFSLLTLPTFLPFYLKILKINELYVVRKPRSTDFEALNLWKSRSGRGYNFSRNLTNSFIIPISSKMLIDDKTTKRDFLHGFFIDARYTGNSLGYPFKNRRGKVLFNIFLVRQLSLLEKRLIHVRFSIIGFKILTKFHKKISTVVKCSLLLRVKFRLPPTELAGVKIENQRNKQNTSSKLAVRLLFSLKFWNLSEFYNGPNKEPSISFSLKHLMVLHI